MTPGPGAVFPIFLTPDPEPKEKRRNLPESTPVIRIRSHLWFIPVPLLVYESLRFFLSELFNMCIVHGYVPNSCLNTTIVPICKNKNGNMSDTSNYRPVAVATVVSKLLEPFILSNIPPFLGTIDNQFGFKAGHSTDQCTFFFKQTASYFVTHGSSVHAVFLDASKAFD